MIDRSLLFRKAHALAKTLTGDYKARFSYSLKIVYKEYNSKKSSVCSFKKETIKMMTSMKKENGKIYVESYYDSSFTTVAKQLGGQWQSPAWVFDEDVEDLVNEAVLKYFGYKENDEIVKIEYKAEDFTRHNWIIVGKKTVAERRRRRIPVDFYDTVVVKGGFNGWSGSAANPSLGTDEGTVLRTTVAKSFLDTLEPEQKEKIKIIAKGKSKSELLAEKAELEKRLAEIAKQLKAMED